MSKHLEQGKEALGFQGAGAVGGQCQFSLGM